jgi:hypothetical protein
MTKEDSKNMKEESDLVYEIMGGKKTTKKDAVATEGTAGISAPKDEKKKDAKKGDDLTNEILYGKNIKAGKITKLSKEDKEEVDEVNEILYGEKKGKKESKKTEPSEEPDEPAVSELTGKKPGKKFDREEYFGL